LAKVIVKIKVARFFMAHGVDTIYIKWFNEEKPKVNRSNF